VYWTDIEYIGLHWTDIEYIRLILSALDCDGVHLCILGLIGVFGSRDKTFDKVALSRSDSSMEKIDTISTLCSTLIPPSQRQFVVDSGRAMLQSLN